MDIDTNNIDQLEQIKVYQDECTPIEVLTSKIESSEEILGLVKEMRTGGVDLEGILGKIKVAQEAIKVQKVELSSDLIGECNSLSLAYRNFLVHHIYSDEGKAPKIGSLGGLQWKAISKEMREKNLSQFVLRQMFCRNGGLDRFCL